MSSCHAFNFIFERQPKFTIKFRWFVFKRRCNIIFQWMDGRLERQKKCFQKTELNWSSAHCFFFNLNFEKMQNFTAEKQNFEASPALVFELSCAHENWKNSKKSELISRENQGRGKARSSAFLPFGLKVLPFCKIKILKKKQKKQNSNLTLLFVKFCSAFRTFPPPLLVSN